MSYELFVIQYDDGVHGFYNDLERAKRELIDIFDKTPDFKHYGYKIIVYKLIENEYVMTKKTYTYQFQMFYTNN